MTAKVLLVLLLGLFLSLFVPGLAQAQPSDEVTQVSKELYCPLCSGLRLDICDLPLCDQMREVIRQKLAAGETKEQIKAYFVEQYGQVVLGVPPKRGGTILAWVLPFLVVLVAGGWMYRLARRWTQRQATEKAEAAAPQPLPAEYVERLERELEQLE
ncbi:MAG: cytochrome c-type biogenesis protein CcmH [Anaerolineae bacterium]